MLFLFSVLKQTLAIFDFDVKKSPLFQNIAFSVRFKQESCSFFICPPLLAL